MHSLLNKAITTSVIGLSLNLAGVAPAAATVVTYTNFAAFNAMIQPTATHDFSGIVSPTGFLNAPADIDGFLFTAPRPIVFGQNYNDGGPSELAHYGFDYFSSSTVDIGPPAKINVNLGINGFSAVGFFYGSFSDGNATVGASLNTGDSFSLQNTPLNAGYETNFIGFVSDSNNIKMVDFQSSAQNLDITQFKVGFALPTGGNVPLPSSFLLLLAGLGFCGFRKVARTLACERCSAAL